MEDFGGIYCTRRGEENHMAKMHFPTKYSAEKTEQYDGPYISNYSKRLSIKALSEEKD